MNYKQILLFLAMILTIILFFAIDSNAQVYDEPIDSTTHYNLRLYAQSARIPAAILNDDKITLDSVLYSLIVWTDTLQYVTVVDTAITKTHLTFKTSKYATGSGQFTTTATTCTLTIAGANTLTETGDVFLLQPYGSSITSNDVLSYVVYDNNKIIVYRPASGTADLKFKWRWIRRY